MMRRIIALNSKGLTCIQGSRYVSAILFLRHAVECLHSMTIAVGPPDAEETTIDTTTRRFHSMNVTLYPMYNQSDLEKISPHNIFNVYTSGFDFSSVTDPERKQQEIAMVLLYNLGLAHHLAGLCSEDSSDPSTTQALSLEEQGSQAHLRRALYYYRTSLALFRSSSEEQPNHDTYFSYVMGLLNNIGHLYCHFCELDEAQSCSDFIKTMLLSPYGPDLGEDDAAFFSSSLLCDHGLLVSAPCA